MITLIVPCHNEEAVLPEVFSRISIAAADWHDEWEVLLIDDGSRDRTWDHMVQFHERDPRWKGIALTRNFGQQAAIGAGLEHAQGDAVVILDADLQDPPEEVWRMLEKWHEGFDIVYGIRQRRPEGWWKRMACAVYYRLLARSASVELPLDAGDFCLMDRRVVEVLLQCREQHPFWRGLRAWTGFRQVGIPYQRPERQAGQSQYSLKKLCKLALDGWLCLAPSPLRPITWLGVVSWLLVMVGGIWWGMSAGLWLALPLAAIQLTGLGVIAEYLGRIHDELRARPRWVIADRVGVPAELVQRPIRERAA
jgi:dolichol-phosphate mannosyltransferase